MGKPDTSWATYEVISGRHQGHNRFGNERDQRFAYRLGGSFVVMDLSWQNGELYLGSPRSGYRGVLVTDGRIAVDTNETGPGHTRLLTILEQGFPAMEVSPVEEQAVEHEGRPAVLRTYVGRDGQRGHVTVDAGSGVAVRIRLGDEVADLTDLRFDDDVEPALFVPPSESHEGWRGGVVHLDDHDGPERFSGSWEPRSGPGSLYLLSPEGMSRAEALDWAFARTEYVYVREGSQGYERVSR
jgi:hypothetical protein